MNSKLNFFFLFIIMSSEEIQNIITEKFIYNNTIDTTTIQNILFISTQVTESQLFYDSANSNTFPIIYSPNSDNNELIELLRTKFQNGIQRISFAFHDPLNNIKTFLDNTPFFDDNDLIENQTTFSQNFTFLTNLITEFKVVNCDFLACNTLQYSIWTTYFNLLNKLTNVICGASNDNTGNILYGADWIMENTNENIRDIYFTSTINNYASSLAAFTVDYVTYSTTGSNATITGFLSPPANWVLTIPSTVTDPNTSIVYNVITIGSTAFYGSTNMISVTIPSSITSVGDYAFTYCTALTSITLQNAIIGTKMFTSCSALTSITIPSSITSIGNYAFQYCTALTSITLQNAIIGTNMFDQCTGLTSITIPSSITSIGISPFIYCTALTSITLQNAIISFAMFQACTALTSITIPSSITTIGGNAFILCSSLTSITLQNAIIGSNMFGACNALLSITIPANITTVNSSAFSTCSALNSITLQNTIIGASMFYQCTALTSITIPSSITSIGAQAFQGCTNLTSVIIDNQAIITNAASGVFNAYNVAPLNKTVLFYLTANYAALTVYGQAIASYFSATPSTETITILYDSNPSCFNEDTKILCLNKNGEEEYIPIQNLRKGDLVKSYLHGYRKIDLIGKGKMGNNIDIWYKSMYILEKTDDNGLIEDFIVTGGHALLVDQLTDKELQTYKEMNIFDNGKPIKIDNKFLLAAGVSSLFKQITEQKIFTFYHLALESNSNDDERFGIYANGILTETVSKNLFNQFNYQLL